MPRAMAPPDRDTPTVVEEGRGSMHMLQLWSCWSFRQGVYDTEAD
jgi:hypothetical protein